MSSYSFDVLKKLAFEKEIELIKSHTTKYTDDAGYLHMDGREITIVEYLKRRIKEIDEEYGQPTVRDF